MIPLTTVGYLQLIFENSNATINKATKMMQYTSIMEEIGPEDFYVVLPSNANPDTRPNNVASKYTVTWETPIQFGNAHEWRVALTEMSYNYNPQSVTSTYGIEYSEKGTFTISKTIEIHGKYKQTPTILEKTIEVPTHDGEIIGDIIELKKSLPTVELDFDGLLVLTNNFRFALNFTSIDHANMAGFKEKENIATLTPSNMYVLKSNSPFYKETKKIEDGAKVVQQDGGGEDVHVYAIDLALRSPEITIMRRKYFNKAKRWNSIEELLNGIRKLFSDIVETIEIDTSTRLIKIVLERETLSIRLLNGLHFVLGFSQTVLWKKEEIADFPPALNRALNHMYVYASIVAPIQVGHMRVPLLKSIWLDVTKAYVHDEVRNVNIRHPMYLPINSASMNSIEVNIRTDSGALVPFTEGSVTSVTLHFKKLRQ